MALGIIGIVLAFAVLLFFTFKNISTLILTVLATFIVAIFNGLPVVDSFTTTYMGGVASLVTTLFPLILLGSILGKIYTNTGAAASIANTFLRVFVDPAKGEKKIWAATGVLIIITCLFQFGGIDSFVVLFATFPMVVTMFKRLNLPRKYIPGMLMCGVGVGASAGAPTVHNVLPMTLLGTTSTAAAIPGILAFLIIEFGSWIMISTLIVRAVRRGEVYNEGEMGDMGNDSDSNRPQPHFVVALLPLAVVFILFSIVKLPVAAALIAGIVLALIMMGRNISLPDLWPTMPKRTKAQQIVTTLNDGAVMSTKAVMEISVVGGLATVAATTPAFQALSGGLMSLPIHPLLLVMIAVFILVAITSAPPAGLSIIIPIIATALIEQPGALGISATPEAVHRICSIACLTFETLPFNGMIVIALDLAKIKHKEGYFPMFMASVFFPIVASVVATVLLIAFPGLA